MGIKITQPFIFESKQPNFERDYIDSSTFENHSPLKITVAEANVLASKYDEGHSVWDVNTKKRYTFHFKTVAGEQVGCFIAAQPLAMTCNEWSASGYVPEAGEIVIFTDYKHVTVGETETAIPVMKVGNGTLSASQLPVIGDYTEHSETSEKAKVAEKLEHKLTIGDQEFDGSADVEIEKYKGENDIS